MAVSASVESMFKYPEEQYKLDFDASTLDSSTSCTITSSLDVLVLTQEAHPPDGAVYVPANLNLTVYADTLKIRGPLHFPGKTVTIATRVLDGEADGQQQPPAISVTGQPGVEPHPAPPPVDGQGPNGEDGHSPCGTGRRGGLGQDGQPGAAGSLGSDGGELTVMSGSIVASLAIALAANGGTGGTGQTGQGGQVGGTGGKGGRCWEWPPIGPCFGEGGDGGVGGAGGPGGQGGAGGKAKKLFVGVIDAPAQPLVSTQVVGGTGGPGGSGGRGGDGGAPGSLGDCGYALQVPVPEVSADRGGPGNPGQQGMGGSGGAGGILTCSKSLASLVTPACTTGGRSGPGSSAGATGTDGAVVVIDFDHASFNPSVAQCSMTLSKARLLYLTGDPNRNPSAYGAAWSLLAWLRNLTARFSNISHSPVGYSRHDVEALQAIYAAAVGLLHQLGQGRDVYGNLQSYVPRGSYTTYQSLLSEALAALAQIEAVYAAYYTDLGDSKATTANLGNAVSQAAAQVTGLTQQVQNLRDKITSDDVAAIAADNTTVAAQKQVMEQATHAFQQELASVAGPSCNFADLENAVSLVTKVTHNADVEQFQSILSAAAGVTQSGLSYLSGWPTLPTFALVKQVGTIDSTLASIQTGYRVSKGLITSDDPNAYKLLAAQRDFDALVQPFMSRVTAQDAVQAVNQYLASVQQLNADIATYNADIGQLAALEGQMSCAAAQLGLAEDALGAKIDPALAPFVAFMTSLYQTARDQVLRILYEACRSFGYWSLSPDYSAFYELAGLNDPSGVNGGSLAALQLKLLADFSVAINSFGMNAQRFPASGDEPGILLRLSEAEFPGLFRSLKTPDNNGDCQVSLRLEPVFKETSQAQSPFFGKSNVRLTKVRPWIVGAQTTDGRLTVIVTHRGEETIVTQQNQPVSFSHSPTPVNFQFTAARPLDPRSIADDGDCGQTGPNAEYAMFGPFTTWTVTIPRAYNTGLDLRSVHSVVLEFWGTYYPFAHPPLVRHVRH